MQVKTRSQGQRTPLGPIDKTIGENIKRCRLLRNLSQSELAKDIVVTFQAVQRYEKGVNRVSSAQLVRIAKALKVPTVELLKGTSSGHETEALPEFLAGMDKSDLTLWHSYRAIACPKQRAALVNLARTMAQAED